MEINNQLYNTMSLEELRERYDSACKAVLSYKAVLAQILKGCVEEYKNEDPKEIEKLIEGEPQVSSVVVDRDEDAVPKISGMNNEDSSVKEGAVFYDILFYAYTPDKTDKIKLIINIEAQNTFSPGYPLVKRALYYCARLISAQKGTEFTNQNYGKIKKVISIWICTEPPAENSNTLTRFSVAKNHLIGSAKFDFKDYDVFDMIMVCLDADAVKDGKINYEDDNFRDIIKFLTYLLCDTLQSGEKKTLLETDYNMEFTQTINEEVLDMCNLSYGLVKKGMSKGEAIGEAKGKAVTVVEMVKRFMETLGYTLSETLAVLGITKEEYEGYVILAGGNNA